MRIISFHQTKPGSFRSRSGPNIDLLWLYLVSLDGGCRNEVSPDFKVRIPADRQLIFTILHLTLRQSLDSVAEIKQADFFPHLLDPDLNI